MRCDIKYIGSSLIDMAIKEVFLQVQWVGLGQGSGKDRASYRVSARNSIWVPPCTPATRRPENWQLRIISFCIRYSRIAAL